MPNYTGGVPMTAFQPQDQFNYQYQPTMTTPSYTPRYWQYQNTTATLPSYNQSVMQQPVNSAMIWVQGEAGAKAYMVPNNSTVALWDSEEHTIYIKSVDQNGKPSMTILDYVDRNGSDDKPEKEEIKSDNYVTKDQLKSITDSVEKQLSSFSEQFTPIKKQLNSFTEQFNVVKDKVNFSDDYVTADQLDSLNRQISILNGHVSEIEDRIMSFGKPQQNSNSNANNRKGKL